jgi:hypothetical protein
MLSLAAALLALLGAQDDTERPAAAPIEASPPTVLPRSLPARDTRGARFGNRVALSPGGTHLAILTNQPRRTSIGIFRLGSTEPERIVGVQGRGDFIGWRDLGTVLVGLRGNVRDMSGFRFAPLDIATLDVATGQVAIAPPVGDAETRRLWQLSNGIYAQNVWNGTYVRDAAGGRTLAVHTGDGGVTVSDCCTGASFAVQSAHPGGPALFVERLREEAQVTLSCPGSAAAFAVPEGQRIVPAGPLDVSGHPVVLIDDEDNGRFDRLARYDCDTALMTDVLYEEKDGFDGALFDPRRAEYYGIWRNAGDPIDVFDASLAHDLAEVEASFGGDVTAYPLDFARGANVMLLYVSGPNTRGGYYTLDRYAGFLDLVIEFDE